MLHKLSTAAILLSALCSASAATSAIGTASTWGDIRVDGSHVQGDATLFDGTIVETAQSPAVLRLNKGVEIRLSTSSRGALYRNRAELQQGSTELTSSSPFQLEAGGLLLAPTEPNSHGLVWLSSGHNLQVQALRGGFNITNQRGLVLASVHSGSELSFEVIPTTPAGTPSVWVTQADGHQYYLAGDALPAAAPQLKSTTTFAGLAGKSAAMAGAHGVVAQCAPPSHKPEPPPPPPPPRPPCPPPKPPGSR